MSPVVFSRKGHVALSNLRVKGPFNIQPGANPHPPPLPPPSSPPPRSGRPTVPVVIHFPAPSVAHLALVPNMFPSPLLPTPHIPRSVCVLYNRLSIPPGQVPPCWFVVWFLGLKPIFHCDAKPFALGNAVGFDPPMRQFCVTYTNMLVSKNAKNLHYPQCEF